MKTGDKIGPYEILGLIGAGGMGEVYKARDTRLDRFVAIKVSKEAFSERFSREVRSIAALNHPNICTLYDVGPKYLVMEYIEGAPLKPPVSVDRAVKYAIQVADALETAHAKGIVHRDIKPSNILITTRDEAKVLDFGLARQADSLASAATLDSDALTKDVLTKTGVTVGTIPYMSPEQIRGVRIDGRTDLWALGVVLYESIAGVRPFEGPTEGMILESVLTKAPAPLRERNSQVPAALDRIVGRCLEKDSSRRYQSAAELCSDLRAVDQSSHSHRAAGRGFRWGITVASAAVMAIALGGYFYLHKSTKLTDKDTIVLADFANTTKDPVFDETLRQGLAVQLEQSPFLSLISDRRIRTTLRLMQQSPDAKLTPEVAQAVCERSGSAAVLEGSIASLGSQYVLGLRAKNCRTGEILDDQQAQVAKKEEVLNTLSQMASRFRTRVGESLATIKEHEVPLVEATTASLDAWKAYSAAFAVNASKGSAAAIPLFKRATELDPNFAQAQAHLGTAYSSIGELALAAEALKKAYALKSHSSDPEKFFITMNYEQNVTGNLEKAFETGELWAQTYPRDVRAHGLLSAFATEGTGRYEKSIEEGRKSIAIEPDFVFGYANAAWSYVFLDRPQEAENSVRAATDRKLESADLFLLRYYIAFLKGDNAAMDREIALAKDQPGADDWIMSQAAMVAAYYGHLQRARDLSRRAVDLAQSTGDKERAATYESGAAVYEALFGNSIEARQRAAAALELSKGRDLEYAAGFALARTKDLSRSALLAKNLELRFPGDTSVRFHYLPTLRALAALNGGNPAKAKEELQPAVRYELAMNGLSNVLFCGAMYPAYVRGEALLAEHKGAEAAAEFQKILDHRGVTLADPIAALARLQIGRAWALAGDTTKAKSAYRDFLTLWKDADSNIPILIQAKAEFARL
jgi:serine/threonine protein kinase